MYAIQFNLLWDALKKVEDKKRPKKKKKERNETHHLELGKILKI